MIPTVSGHFVTEEDFFRYINKRIAELRMAREHKPATNVSVSAVINIPNMPVGWHFKDFRPSVRGDYVIHHDKPYRVVSPWKTPVVIIEEDLPLLRSLPSFVPRGIWLYQSGYDGQWYFCRKEPIAYALPPGVTGWTGVWRAGFHNTPCPVDRFYAINGAKFFPPTYGTKFKVI